MVQWGYFDLDTYDFDAAVIDYSLSSIVVDFAVSALQVSDA